MNTVQIRTEAERRLRLLDGRFRIDEGVVWVQIRTEAERRLRLNLLTITFTVNMQQSKFGLKPKGD